MSCNKFDGSNSETNSNHYILGYIHILLFQNEPKKKKQLIAVVIPLLLPTTFGFYRTNNLFVEICLPNLMYLKSYHFKQNLKS